MLQNRPRFEWVSAPDVADVGFACERTMIMFSAVERAATAEPGRRTIPDRLSDPNGDRVVVTSSSDAPRLVR
jgi:hypothetical protein